MPATSGITDPDDPGRKQREAVIERVDSGHISVRHAAEEMGISQTWVRKLLADHGRGVADPAQLRIELQKRLASDRRRCLRQTKTTVEPVFGNLKATSDSDGSHSEASTSFEVNGGSSAPSTTCSNSTDTS